MKVIEAVNEEPLQDDCVCVFLAGGITNCPDWQQDVIKGLQEYEKELDNLVVYNPRRANFPIHDPNAAGEQIKWEFDHLQTMEIFSMFFSGGESDQPICMYELGRNLLAMHIRFPGNWKDRVVISCDAGYKRKQDVEIQSELAMNESGHVFISDDYDVLIDHHVRSIVDSYHKILGEY